MTAAEDGGGGGGGDGGVGRGLFHKVGFHLEPQIGLSSKILYINLKKRSLTKTYLMEQPSVLFPLFLVMNRP